tara:strand:+ start:1687 stop:2574 length:888 start_codon:yes stop_codon:yes gene_type:complete
MNIVILGGTGFIGRNLVNMLSSEEYSVKVPTRNREKNKKFLVYPGLQLVQCNIHNQDELVSVTRDCDILINLVGILNERGFKGKGFEAVHSNLARTILYVCKVNNIRRVLHMSALNANSSGPSFYLRTKGDAESYMHTYGERFTNITTFRPSVVFGKGDGLINRFSNLINFIPFYFPLACANTKFSPIYVRDLSYFIINCIDNVDSYQKRYNLCGPKVYTLQEIVELVIHFKKRKTKVIPLTDNLSKLQAYTMQLLPGKPFSIDNYNSCKIDSIGNSDYDFYTELESVIPGCIER